MKKQLSVLIGTLVLILCISSAAQAVPTLQLFIDGAEWDAVLETWIVTEGTFDLWVIGETATLGTIYDVKLAASMYGNFGGTVNIKRTDNGGNIRAFGGSSDFMYSATATPDGKIVVGGGYDSVLRIWNGANGQVIQTLEAPKPQPPKGTAQAAK